MSKNWWSVPKREPNGRRKRHWTPDRGTQELQDKRKQITGSDRAPIDLDDPIDVLHRGKDAKLTDTQALAAKIWRKAREDVLGGEGPRLALRRDELGSEGVEDPTREIRAREDLNRIYDTMRRQHSGIHFTCCATVERKEPPLRIEYLQQGLDAVARALKL